MKNKEYPVFHRILHWTIAVGLFFMLITIFLRLNWMEKAQVGEIIKQQLTSMDINITDRQAVSIGRAVRSPMWQWHLYGGYFLLALFLLRLFYFFKGGVFFNSPFSKELNLKEKVQSAVYLLFYVFLGLSLFSGMMIVWGPDSFHDLAETIHKPSLIWLMVFLILHFIGLIRGELVEEKGIISKMIYGRNLLNKDQNDE